MDGEAWWGYSVGHDGVTERVHARAETKHFQL